MQPLREISRDLWCWKKVRLTFSLILIIVTGLWQAVGGNGSEGAVSEVIIIIAGTVIVIMQHLHIMVTTGPGLIGASEALQSLSRGLIFEMDVFFMAIHSYSPPMPALVSPVTLMVMNYTRSEIISIIHLAFNFGKSEYILKAT